MKKHFKLITTVLLAFMAVSCGPEVTHVHSYDSEHITWNWAGDYSTCEAEVKCATCDKVVETVDADVTSKVVTPAACDHAGLKEFTASIMVGELSFSDKKEQVLQKLPHQYGDEIPEVPSTCKEHGVHAHFECGSCGGLFVLQDGQYIEVTEEDLKLELAEHQYGIYVDEEPAGCETSGIAGHYHCTVCNKYFNAQKEEISEESLYIAPLGHDYGDLIPQVDPECGVPGMLAHYECSRCHKLFVKENDVFVEKTAKELEIAAEEHVFGPWTSISATEHKHVCGKCRYEETAAHEFVYEQVGTDQHTKDCSLCDFEAVTESCSYEWFEDGYRCACGRKPALTIQERIFLDLELNGDGDVVFGADAENLVVSGYGTCVIEDVEIGNVSVWDKTNKKFSKEVIYYPGEQTLSVTVGNGTFSETVEGLKTTFVSAIFSTEAELRQMSDIAKEIGADVDVYNGYFELGANITLSVPSGDNYTWEKKYSMPIDKANAGNAKKGFLGVLDGKGYSINKVNIQSAETSQQYSGFISAVNGVVKNLSLIKVQMPNKVQGAFGLGCGTIENVHVAAWTVAGNYTAPLFGGNTQTGHIPTIKNCILELQNRDGWTFTPTTRPDGGNILAGNWNGNLPVVEGLKVVTSNATAKQYAATNREGGAFVSKTIDQLIEAGLDITVYDNNRALGDSVTDEWRTSWNAIWKTGDGKLPMVDDKFVEMKVEKAKSTNAVVDDLINITAASGTKTIQYSLDNSKWTDLVGTTIDTTTIYDVSKVYIRCVNAANTIIDSKEVEIDRKMYLGTSGALSTDTSVPLNGNAQNGMLSTCKPVSGKGADSTEDKDVTRGIVSSRYFTYQDGQTSKAAYCTQVKIYGVADPTNAGLLAKSKLAAWIFRQGAAVGVTDYYNKSATSADEARLVDVKKINVWYNVSKIKVVYDDDTFELLDKFYTPEIAITPTNSPTGNPALVDLPQKEGGYDVNTWYQFSYDVSAIKFDKNGMFFCNAGKIRVFNPSSNSGDCFIGSTFHGKVVKDIKFNVAYDGASFSY